MATNNRQIIGNQGGGGIREAIAQFRQQQQAQAQSNLRQANDNLAQWQATQHAAYPGDQSLTAAQVKNRSNETDSPYNQFREKSEERESKIRTFDNAMQGNFLGLAEDYLNKNFSGRTLDDFLLNSTQDEMYDFVNAPLLRDWYTGYGDLSDRDTFNQWFDNNETNNNIGDMEGIFSSPERVLQLYGTDAPTGNFLNQAFTSAGVQMQDADGNYATAENLGLTGDDADALAVAANTGMMNQGLLGTYMLLPDVLPYLTDEDVNMLAGENIEYGIGDDFMYNNPDNPEGVRDTINMVPTFEQMWMYDPDIYQRSVDENWNATGLGSGFSGLANLLANNGGLSYRRRSDQE